MADDDWDLYAVVRSCNSATNTATTTSNPIHHGGSSEEPSWMWDRVMKREELETNVGFPNLESRAEAFQGLEEFYLPFFPNPTIDNTTTTTTTTTTNTSSYAAAGTIIPNSSTSFISDFGGGSSSSGQHQLQQQQNNFVPANTNAAITPHFNPGFTPVSGFGRFHEHQQLKQLETPDHPQELIAADPRRKAAVPSVGPLMPTMQIPPQLIRPRKRKNQVKKVVCHLTADNLSSDLWAWRKYGQKPIKGSPHPRNYYRCSSSKGCSARKQVERSTEDSGMFVVTYAGEHTHPRPTHRNSLAGSTRNKPAATTQKAKDSGSPASSAQVLAAQGEDDEQTGNNNSVDGDKASEEAEDEEIEEDEDDEEFLVPNMGVSEDIFLGMKQLGRTASGGSTLGSLAVGTSGDGFSTKSSNLGSSWGTNCSSSAGATVGGGC